MIDAIIVSSELKNFTSMISYLEQHDVHVACMETSAHLERILSLAPKDLPSLAIIDGEMSNNRASELTARIRKKSDIGIVLLSTLQESKYRIQAFQAGADIYLDTNAPFEEIFVASSNLAERITLCRERAAPSSLWLLNRFDWKLISPANIDVCLTAMEFAFLKILVNRNGVECSRTDLIAQLSRPRTNWGDQHLDAVVSRLRRKVQKRAKEKLPVKMVYGKGYIFTAPCQFMDADLDQTVI
nr:winged helix-turn-helix domain-containing protein [uncultured Cohaesibacter sp.]